MKKKLTVLMLSAILAVSGATAINYSFNGSAAKAEDKPFSKYFEYGDAITLTENKNVPTYLTNGAVSSGGVKTFKSGVYGADKPLGIGVTATANSVINLKNPIYVGDNTLSTPLIEFMVTPTNYVEGHKISVSTKDIEFERVVITLTDVNDKSNYVQITSRYSATNSDQSWIEVGTANIARAGMNAGRLTSEDKQVYGSGTGISSGFTGESDDCAAIFYVDSELAFYAADSIQPATVGLGKSVTIVRDLDETTQLYSTDTAFSGFSTGFVNVSISIEGLKSEEAHMILKSIDGQDLVSENGEIIDNCAPAISVDKSVLSNVPDGEANRLYPFAKTEVIDFIDGTDVTKVVEVYDSENNTVASTAEGFVPSAMGDYKVVYYAVDSQNKVSAKQEVIVRVTGYMPDFILNFNDDSEIIHTAPIGKEVKVPSAYVSGGSGNSSLNVYVVYATTGEVVSTRSMFTPERPGWYKIVYEYTDYLAGTKTFVIDVDASLSNAPVFSEVSMPEVILANKYFEIPKATAIDYASFNGEGKEVNAVAEVKYEYTKDGSLYQVDWQNAGESFKPTFSEGKVFIRYKATALLDETAVAYSDVYEIEVKDLSTTSNLYKFFNLSSEYIEDKDISVGSTSRHRAFYATKSGEHLQFVNKLPAESFKVTLNFDQEYSVIKKLRVVIQDSVKAAEKVTFTITPNTSDLSKIEFNQTTYPISGGFYASKRVIGGVEENIPGSINLTLKDTELYTNLTRIAAIKTYDNGADFNGFTSGKLYFSVYFDEIDSDVLAQSGKSSVRFTELCDQARFSASGKDNRGPNITLGSSLSTYYDMNSYVTLPSAYATDLFDPNVTVKLTVTKPNGEVLVSQSADTEYVLHLEEIGSYNVEYFSVDSTRNETRQAFSLYSADTFDPVIEIDGQFKSKAKINEEYTLHKAKAYDNYDKPEDLRIYVYVFDPDGYIECPVNGYGEVDSYNYKFTKTGTYRIRYFVMDSYGNYCHRVFMVNVSA